MKLDDIQKLSRYGFSHTEEDQQKVFEYLRSVGIDPSDVYQEMEMSSPYVNTHRDTTYSNATIALHSHDYFEVLYCRSGGVEYLVGPERYRLQKGDVVLVPPGVSHRPILSSEQEEPYVRDVVWFSNAFMDQVLTVFTDAPLHIFSRPELIRTAGTRWEFLGDMFRIGVSEEEEKHPGWEISVIGNTMNIVTSLIRIHNERSSGIMKAEKAELLDQVRAYIEKHYTEHITIDDIARKFYVSNSTVSHQFKQKMGVSIYRYVTQRRLIAAKILIHRKMPLENVAHEVGFVDYSSFYRAFKQEYGISPRKFGQK